MFLRLPEQGRLEQIGDVKAHCFTCVRSAALNSTRRHARSVALDADAAWFEAPKRDYVGEANLRRALGALTEDQRMRRSHSQSWGTTPRCGTGRRLRGCRTDQQAKELNLILDGTAPYSDLKYRALVGRNKSALDTMARGAAIPECDWGVNYELGSEAPVDYARKALALGRLNVLYAFHLLQNGDTDGAVRVLGSAVKRDASARMLNPDRIRAERLDLNDKLRQARSFLR